MPQYKLIFQLNTKKKKKKKTERKKTRGLDLNSVLTPENRVPPVSMKASETVTISITTMDPFGCLKIILKSQNLANILFGRGLIKEKGNNSDIVKFDI